MPAPPLSLLLSNIPLLIKGLSLSQKYIASTGISPIMLCVHFERLGAYQRTKGSETYLLTPKRWIEQFQHGDLKGAILSKSQYCKK